MTIDVDVENYGFQLKRKNCDGWNIITIWKCDLKREKKQDSRRNFQQGYYLIEFFFENYVYAKYRL